MGNMCHLKRRLEMKVEGGAEGSGVVFEGDCIRLWLNSRGVVSQELTSPVEP
jgi:hypothetical protein